MAGWGPVVQRLERAAHNGYVAGSDPAGPPQPSPATKRGGGRSAPKTPLLGIFPTWRDTGDRRLFRCLGENAVFGPKVSGRPFPRHYFAIAPDSSLFGPNSQQPSTYPGLEPAFRKASYALD